jgi:DNA mismatch repair protein MutL
LRPSLDFQNDTNLIDKLSSQGANKDVYYEERFQTMTQRNNLLHWQKMVEGEWMGKSNPIQQKDADQLSFAHQDDSLPDSSNRNSNEVVIFQMQGKYIVRSVQSGLLFIDQQAAHERVLFEKFSAQLKNKSGESQQSLFPQTVTLSAADFALLMEIEQEISALGFRVEVFGKNTLLIQGIPAGVFSGKEKQLLEGLLEQFKINQAELSVPMNESLARALAKRAAIKAGQKLMAEEMRSLADALVACKTPNYAPDGSPTFFIFEFSKIENYFKRQ